ncbi:MAG: reverse transcriptase domain-containing protein, partial [Cyanobacteria bacterium J06553_1]
HPTLKEALGGKNKEQWLQAIGEEMEALKIAKTWTVTERPKGQKVLPSQFILRVKRGSGGEIIKYKARLVVLGNLQRPNIDYFETYAPVVEFTVVRVLLILASTLDLTIRQLDVKSAFLNGCLKETIFMSLPKDFALPEGQVCHLKKSLYGLKQAPKAWNEKLTADFEKINFKSSKTAESVFYQREKGRTTYLLLYVDDMLILAPTEEEADRVVQQIKSLYEIKDLGKAEFFLGVKIEQPQEKVTKISQSRYINEVLERFKMETCKPISTPLSDEGDWFKRLSLTTAEENEMKNIPYREAIGSLLFLSTRTRPDIATAVNILAKHSETPHPKHWKGIKRILRYLQGSKNEGIVLKGAKNLEDLQLECYVDADWGADVEDRSSRTGVICYLSGNPIWWKSRKQHSIAVSTCEAEYMALFEGAKDVIWLRNVLCEFGLCAGETATTIFTDNQSSITWAKNPGLRKVKHIDLRYNFSQEQIEKKIIRVEYVQSSENAADILTKNLSNCVFQKAKKLLSISA